MSQEVRTPLQVTAVTSVADTDYIDLTLANGSKARVLKSKLLPVATATTNGLMNRGVYRIVPNASYTAVVKLCYAPTGIIHALYSIYYTGKIALIEVTMISGNPIIKIISGTLDSGVKFYLKGYAVYIRIENVGTVYKIGSILLYQEESGFNYVEITSDNITDATLISIS